MLSSHLWLVATIGDSPGPPRALESGPLISGSEGSYGGASVDRLEQTLSKGAPKSHILLGCQRRGGVTSEHLPHNCHCFMFSEHQFRNLLSLLCLPLPSSVWFSCESGLLGNDTRTPETLRRGKLEMIKGMRRLTWEDKLKRTKLFKLEKDS